MKRRDQQFTFIDVTEQKQVNKKKIKSHVANDVNRKKRQSAVERYLGSRQHPGLEQSLLTSGPASSLGVVVSQVPKVEVSSPRASPLSGRTAYSSLPDRSNIPCAATERRDSISYWRETYHDSWSTFTTSLSKSKRDARRTDPTERPVAWLQRRSSSDESAETLGSNDSASSEISSIIPNRRSSYISRIDPPASLAKAEGSLSQIKAFFIGQHDSTWLHFIKQDPYYYQHDYEVGIWRDCFHIAFDHLQVRKPTEALAIMDASLGATSNLLKKQHPSLFYSLLEIMLETKDIQDAKLSSMVQGYLVQMAVALLGVNHPMVIVMKNMRSQSSDPQEHPDVMFQAIIDLIIDLFGANHFQTLGTQFGSIRRHILRGNHDVAQSVITQVRDVWNQVYPKGSVVINMVDIESARVSNARSGPPVNIQDYVGSTLR